MNPFDYAKSFTALWSGNGEAFFKAQEEATKAIADGMRAMAAGQFPSFMGDPGAGGADLAQASKAVMELFQAAGTLSAALVSKLPAAAGSDTVDSTFRHMVDPRSWMVAGGEMDDVLGRMAEGPRFADLWDMERRYAQVMKAWVEVRRSGLEHNVVVLEAWMRAGRAFAEDLGARADHPPQDRRAMLALWTEIANRELIETQRSEPFLNTQSAMIRASTELRIAQQDLVEHVGKQYGFPTRTELDDVHRTVTELKRELRAMRRETRLAAAKPAPLPIAAPALTIEPQPIAKKAAAKPKLAPEPTRAAPPAQRTRTAASARRN